MERDDRDGRHARAAAPRRFGAGDEIAATSGVPVLDAVDGLPAGARRPARDLGDRGHLLPRRVRLDARRLLRRRSVLRGLRLPDHVTADRGARTNRADRAAPVLGAPGAPVAAGTRCGARHGGDVDGRVRVRRTAFPDATRPAVVDVLRRQLGPGPWRRALLRGGRSTAAPAPVEPRGRGAVVPDLAVRVRAVDAPAAHTDAMRRLAGRPRGRDHDVHVLAPFGWPVVARRPCVRGIGSHQLHVPVDVHPLDRTAARGGGRVRVATVAYTHRGPARPGTPTRRCMRRRDRDARLHLRCGDDHRRLRVPVAAAARFGVVVGGGVDGRAPGRARREGGVLDDAAGRDRSSELRAVPLALADLRVRRRYGWIRRPVRARARGHCGRVRALLPVHRDADP